VCTLCYTQSLYNQELAVCMVASSFTKVPHRAGRYINIFGNTSIFKYIVTDILRAKIVTSIKVLGYTLFILEELPSRMSGRTSHAVCRSLNPVRGLFFLLIFLLLFLFSLFSFNLYYLTFFFFSLFSLLYSPIIFTLLVFFCSLAPFLASLPLYLNFNIIPYYNITIFNPFHAIK